MRRKQAEAALWSTEQAHNYVVNIRSCGGVGATVMLIIWAGICIVLAVLGQGYPFFPSALLNYGWCYHILNVGMATMCLVVVGTRSKSLVTLIALVTSLLILPLNAWSMVANFVPWLVGCINSHPVTFFADCATGAIYTITITAISIGFFIVSLVVTIKSFALISYINSGRKGYAYDMAAAKYD